MPGLISTLCIASRLSAALRFGREQVEVDRHSQREVAGAVRVNLVTRPAGRTFGHELRLEGTGVSSVALSKSITPSNRPDVRMNSLSALRLSSCSGKPCAAF